MVHQSNPNRAPDSDFEAGSYAHLVKNNSCRLLDQRRTPGTIENIDFETGFFRWRIGDFEDKGRFWDVPLEDVVRYQFAKNSSVLDASALQEITSLVEYFRKPLIITPSVEQLENFQREIDAHAEIAKIWLQKHSDYFKKHSTFDFQKMQGSNEISSDLLKFLKENDVAEIEKKTADTYVLNPQSGEWIKGLQIAAAEAGMKEFRGLIVRTKDLFDGIGSRQLRQKYMKLRLGFVVALFDLLGKQEVILYRGMSTDGSWSPSSTRFFSSWTFSKEVAESFARLEPHQQSKNSYLLKRTLPTRKLFMTYIETREMNLQYQEVEAVVAHDPADERLW